MREAKNSEIERVYQFGEFRLKPHERRLFRNGQPVALTPKAFDTLLVLVKNSGHVMTKEELLRQVWPYSTVEEVTLAQNVSMLRKALGKHFIQTLPKRGYRFAADVIEVSAHDESPCRNSHHNAELLVSGEENLADTTSFRAKTNEKPKLLPYQLVLALALLVMPSAFAYFVFFREPPKSIRIFSSPRSLAVLPFRNLRQETSPDFLGFALADAVVTKLGYVGSLTVRPSSYVDKYRAQEIDPKRVAVDLNINTLVTGTYIREGDELRITTQLVDALTNETLKKETLELKYENLMTVQERITQQVIRGLHLTPSSIESERLKRDATQNLLAYEYYLRGVEMYATNRLPQAIELLEKSLVQDANYALAWSRLGAAYTAKASTNLGEREDYVKAREAYQKALTLNPEQNEARVSMATFLTDTNRVEEAVPLLREVLKNNPSLAPARWELSQAYRVGGLLKEALAEAEQARQLDVEIKTSLSVPTIYLYAGQYEKFLSRLPRSDSTDVTFYRGWALYHLKDFARAAAEFNRAYEADRETTSANISKALALAIAGNVQQGLEQLRDTEKMATARSVNEAEMIYVMAQAYAILGDKVSALRMLRRSIENGFFCYPYFADDPLLNPLRSEPEFTQLLPKARQRHEEFKRRFSPS